MIILFSTILQILIDQRDPEAVDTEGKTLPSLIYMAREKRPEWHHNFKAGAMNALVCMSYHSFMMHMFASIFIHAHKLSTHTHTHVFKLKDELKNDIQV